MVNDYDTIKGFIPAAEKLEELIKLVENDKPAYDRYIKNYEIVVNDLIRVQLNALSGEFKKFANNLNELLERK